MFDSSVQSVRRALLLLEEVNRRRITSIHSLHQTTGLPKPTIVRLLATMVKMGYVANDVRLHGYHVTSRVRSLSAGFEGVTVILEAARQPVADFTRRFKWPIAIGVREQSAIVVHYSTDRTSPVSPFYPKDEAVLPMLTRAMGRAYIAFCPSKERAELLNKLAKSKHPEDRLARQRSALIAGLSSVRRAGFAHRCPNVEPKSSNTLAVPIMYGSRVLATIGMSYFTSAVPRMKAVEQYAPALQELARAIETNIEKLKLTPAPSREREVFPSV